ncbi:MAG: glycine cleavage system protein H [Cyanobacteria bacterium]|nr:glycine cleavage system protein H [Cyanobacteriota bacterium]MDA1020901.1 glycine cleavage system protein H [Cyanobacteriota bacterium]
MVQYFKSHEWIAEKGEGVYQMGISQYACDQLGDIVFVEAKEDGEVYDSADSLAILESVKAVGDIYAPFKAKLISTNKEVVNSPEEINSKTWIIEISSVDGIDFDDLDTMNSGEYDDYLETL